MANIKRTVQILGDLQSDDKGIPLDQSFMSIRLFSALEKAGISDLRVAFGMSNTAIARISNIGKKTLNEFEELKRHFGYGNDDSQHDEGASSDQFDQIEMSNRLFNSLMRNGISTIDDVVALSSEDIWRLKGVGQKTFAELEVLKRQLECGDFPGRESDLMAEPKCDHVLLPVGFDESLAGDFYGSVKLAFLEFSGLSDPRSKAILLCRIWPQSGAKGATLEELGNRFGCTRERVRQIEKKILKRLIAFFCHGTPLRMPRGEKVSLNPSLVGVWQAAANQIAQSDEISLEEFSEVLIRECRVSGRQLKELLPLVISVFTQSTSGGVLGEFNKCNFSHFDLAKASASTMETPLSSLRIGKDSGKLQELSIVTLRDFDSCWADEDMEPAVRRTEDKVSILVRYLDEKGDVDWAGLAAEIGVFRESSIHLFDANRPFESLLRYIEYLIPHVVTWQNCLEVYRLRTSKQASQRKTLAEVSELLNGKKSSGPSVARIEKYLLEKLSAVVLRRDFSTCSAWVSEDLCRFFERCSDVFDRSSDDFYVFEEMLAKEFGVAQEEVGSSSHLIWAIINGLPPLRYHHLSQRAMPTRDAAGSNRLTGKLKLAGFKRVF